PHKMQAGLLRVLQEHTVRPVGGALEEPVDCRFIFATHRDLNKLVREGKFREDLYYRIHVVELPLPPLRERLEDIPLLVDHFLGIFAARYKRDRKGLTRAALRALTQYSWPGNVRQLEHTLLNAWILCEGEDIERDDLELPRMDSEVHEQSELSTQSEFASEDAETDTADSNGTEERVERADT